MFVVVACWRGGNHEQQQHPTSAYCTRLTPANKKVLAKQDSPPYFIWSTVNCCMFFLLLYCCSIHSSETQQCVRNQVLYTTIIITIRGSPQTSIHIHVAAPGTGLQSVSQLRPFLLSVVISLWRTTTPSDGQPDPTITEGQATTA